MKRIGMTISAVLCIATIPAVCFSAKHVWIKPVYYSDQQYTNDPLYGYLTNSEGIIIGVDTRLNQKDVMGGGFSYFNAKQKDINNTDTSVNINNYNALVYGTNYFTPIAYLEWLASAGFNNYKGQRAATSSIFATSSYNGEQIIGRVVFNKIYCHKQLQFIPQLNANLIYLHQASYNEQGAGGLNQNVKANNAGVFTLGAGFKITTLYARSKYQMIPELRCIVFYDVFAADMNALTANLIGGPVITTSTVPGRSSGQIGASLTANVSKTLRCALSYDLLVKSSYFNNVVALQLKYMM